MPVRTLVPVGAWLWSKYGKSLTDKATGALKGEWDRFQWSDAAERYRTKTKKLYGTMQIMGMAEPVPLDDIFTDAYMLDKPTAFGRYDIERLKELAADPDALTDAVRMNGLRLVVEKDNLFILGKPGAGKSTFLKYIALKAAEQTVDKIPIFISLKHWADSGKKLMPFIIDRFEICDFPEAGAFLDALLKSGKAILLFDGLDEVNQESGQRDGQIRAINDFVSKYDRTQCLITCRIAASDYSFQPFTYIEIADFTEKQIKLFVGNWFRNDEGQRDAETSKRFLDEFQKGDNQGLRDLARTPLLLTLLCLAFGETLTFPQRRVEIYDDALDALLKKWDSSRRIKRDEVYRKLSLGHKENMLARIAAETFEKDEYFIPQQQLEKSIADYVTNVPPHDTNEATDGEVILKAMEAQHGIFVERAHGVYSFSHRTFQEYFAAKYIVANAAKGTLTNLINVHCPDDRWREVFLLTTSLLPDGSEFMKTFRRRVDVWLEEDETLRELLAWADSKSAISVVDPWLARPVYIFTEVAEFLFQSVILNAVLGLDRSTSLDPNLKLDVQLGYSLAIGTYHPIGLVRELGSNEFALELSEISRRSEKDQGKEEYEKLASESRSALIALMRKHRGIGLNWNLSEASKNRLVNYLEAARLFQDCLELATMSPIEKTRMLNSLYLPLNK